MKILSFLLINILCVVDIFEQKVWCRCGCTGWKISWILFYNIFTLCFIYKYWTLPAFFSPSSYTNIITYFSSGEFHSPDLILLLWLEVLYHYIKFLCTFVGYIHVSHIPNYIYLMPVNCVIGYTDAIRVGGKTLLKCIFGQIFVE